MAIIRKRKYKEREDYRQGGRVDLARGGRGGGRRRKKKKKIKKKKR